MALRADDVDIARDRDLVERFQHGDAEAFDDLYRRYHRRLVRFCRLHTDDGHEAEEVAQEAFVRAYRKLGRLNGEQRFYPWLTVVAKRIAIDRYRSRARRDHAAAHEGHQLGDHHDDRHDERLFEAVDAEQVRAAMANLGHRHRTVLALREVESLSYAEIAERLDVPITTVEALLHRARKALRREYTTLTGADGRGFWGLPLIGVLGPTLTRWRDRLGDRWLEIAAASAPIAVAAITAAVVVLPSDAPPHEAPSRHEAPTNAPIGEFEAPEADPSAPVIVAPASPPPTPTDHSTAKDHPPGPTPAPTLDSGAVDVFVGEDAHDEAAGAVDQSEQSAAVGPARVGTNPSSVTTYLRDAFDFLAGPDGVGDAESKQAEDGASPDRALADRPPTPPSGGAS